MAIVLSQWARSNATKPADAAEDRDTVGTDVLTIQVFEKSVTFRRSSSARWAHWSIERGSDPDRLAVYPSESGGIDMAYQGICYQPFPPGYNPSTANQTWIFFGSDIAYDAMRPLWSNAYVNSKRTAYQGRNDLITLHDMNVNLIRLYDWEPRNKHGIFLDECSGLYLSVLAPVSNYFLKEGYGNRLTLIPGLIRSFSNAQGTDYHQAIRGIIIGNEPRLNGFGVNECIQFTKDWVSIEQAQFGSYRKLPIGHPVDFNQYGGQYPCWGFWDPLTQALNDSLGQRLFLAPQTYNTAEYLFQNAEGSGQGYVDLTWNRYQKPLCFTEIGLGRDKPNHVSVVHDQLRASLQYDTLHPGRIFGACFFQFADKVWMQGTPEGMFGAYSHTNNVFATIQYSAGDFTHWDVPEPVPDQMTVDDLTPSDLLDAVMGAYKGS
jgi:hypothetical protein